jgi:hypothetical protein
MNMDAIIFVGIGDFEQRRLRSRDSLAVVAPW